MVSRVHFVLPAYNESASISDLIDRIVQVCGESELQYSILVIDDGSVDDTAGIASRKGESLPVTTVRNDRNHGLGFTIRRGLEQASQQAPVDAAIVTLDADLTQDPAYVPRMLAMLDEGADVVIASRYRRGSGIEGLSLLRRILSFCASALVIVCRPIRGVRDYSCGFRAYRAGVLRDAFDYWGDAFIQEDGFGCMVEIAQRLRGSARFVEVPFVLHYGAKRKGSAIKILPTMWAYVRVLVRVSKAKHGGTRE